MLTSKMLKQRITKVRQEIKVQTVKYHVMRHMPEKVYYDQMEELNATLSRLRKQLEQYESDPLEQWCKENPSDFECRTYDM